MRTCAIQMFLMMCTIFFVFITFFADMGVISICFLCGLSRLDFCQYYSNVYVLFSQTYWHNSINLNKHHWWWMISFNWLIYIINEFIQNTSTHQLCVIDIFLMIVVHLAWLDFLLIVIKSELTFISKSVMHVRKYYITLIYW